MRAPPGRIATIVSEMVRFSVASGPAFETQTDPSTQIASVPALFVTVTLYVAVADAPDWSSIAGLSTALSMVQSKLRVQ